MDIDDAISRCISSREQAARVAERRNAFLSSIDLGMMTQAFTERADMMDEAIEEDIAANEMQIDYFSTLKARGYVSTTQQIGFESGAPFNVAPASDEHVPYPDADLDDVAF
jgi:hypothetical protein